MGDVINLEQDTKSQLETAKKQCRARMVLKQVLDELAATPEPEYFEPVDYILVRLFDEGIILAEIDNSGDDNEAA